MTPNPQRLRLSDFQVGDHWLVFNPTRVVRVIAREPIDVPNMTGGISQQACLRLRATIATWEIPGYIGKAQVKANRIIKNSIVQACAGRDEADDEWTEFWTERMVFPVKHDARFGARIDDGVTGLDGRPAPTLPQLYCFKEEGKHDVRARHSPTARGQIEAVKLAEGSVPVKLFRADPEPPEPVSVQTARPDNGELPRQIGSLRRIAKERGMDISDIKGKGAVDRIISRLENQTGQGEPHAPQAARQEPDGQGASPVAPRSPEDG